MAGRHDKPAPPYLFLFVSGHAVAGKFNFCRFTETNKKSAQQNTKGNKRNHDSVTVWRLRNRSRRSTFTVRCCLAWGSLVCLIGRQFDRFGAAEKTDGQTVVPKPVPKPVIHPHRRRTGPDIAGAGLCRAYSLFGRRSNRGCRIKIAHLQREPRIQGRPFAVAFRDQFRDLAEYAGAATGAGRMRYFVFADFGTAPGFDLRPLRDVAPSARVLLMNAAR
jgi:hypothetical protein